MLFAYAKTKAQISCAAADVHSNCAADQHLCFRYIDSTIPLFFFNPKLKAFNHPLWLYSLICVEPS